MSDENWFAPKRFGYGAGLPIAWQGWALIATYGAALLCAGLLLTPRHPGLFVVMAIALSISLMFVSAQHTRGGWKWRWNDDD